MRIPAAKAWTLPSKVSFEKLLGELSPSFSVRHKPGRVQKIEVLDDFDWSFWHAGASVVRFADKTHLLAHSEQELSCTPLRKPAKFWWDFPTSPFQDVFKRLNPLRAVTPIATVRYAVHNYELLNEDEKVVVRLKLIQHYSAETQQSRKIIGVYLQANPLIGYQDEFERVLGFIQGSKTSGSDSKRPKSKEHKAPDTKAGKTKSKNAKVNPSPLPNVQQLCSAQGLAVKPRAKKVFGIKPNMAAQQAVQLMGQHLLTAALEQKAGLLDDLDTEFLHQYRVNLRKFRSLVSLLKTNIHPDLQTKLKTLSSEAFAPTNRLRDLDVFLLDRYQYDAMLPEDYRQGIDGLYKRILQERQRCRNAVVRTLSSKRYQQILATLQAALAGDDSEEHAAGQIDIAKVAKKRINSRYKKVCGLGQAINDSTPDEEVHELRKECKKLRYLIEFFAELFPKKTTRQLLKQLKGLQDILGQFNDYSVQQEFLADMANREKTKTVLAAINGLVAVLHQKQIEARGQVVGAFVKFANQETTALVSGLAVSK